MTALEDNLSIPRFNPRTMAARFELEDDEAEISNSPLGIASIAIGIAFLAVTAATVVAGYLALTSGMPAVWIHRLTALAVVQSILIAAIAMKVLPLVRQQQQTLHVLADDQQLEHSNTSASAQASPIEPQFTPPPLPEPVVGGTLAGREYLTHADGSIEIDTLLGRRRFVSLEAAREFVGT